MPYLPTSRVCYTCGRTWTGKGLRCPLCRPSSSIDRGEHKTRSYYATAEWRKIRAEVLTAERIPKDLWPRYDIDHRPDYNPDIEPDHRKYTLVPMLHREHSRKTAQTMNRKGGLFAKKRGDA